jgi:hypothetical protein
MNESMRMWWRMMMMMIMMMMMMMMMTSPFYYVYDRLFVCIYFTPQNSKSEVGKGDNREEHKVLGYAIIYC